jgi:N-acetylglutamate synthase-like GNAT family acetyltransferase
MRLKIRNALPEELEPLLALQQRSLRELGALAYPPDTLEGALAQMGTMDPRMIADGTYLVAELNGTVVGCAGWTQRPLNFGRLLREHLPALPVACGRAGQLRSLYVAPEVARCGIGRALLGKVERQMAEHGIETAELVTALCGEMFFRAHGYVALSAHVVQLAGGMEFEVRRMVRALPERGCLVPGAAAMGSRPPPAPQRHVQQ